MKQIKQNILKQSRKNPDEYHEEILKKSLKNPEKNLEKIPKKHDKNHEKIPKNPRKDPKKIPKVSIMTKTGAKKKIHYTKLGLIVKKDMK